MNRIAFATAGLVAALFSTLAGAATPDWTKVDSAMGRKGTDQPGGIHKFSFPRSDLKVTVDGVAIKPALALGGWLAFEPEGSSAMVMGDLVLTDTEINPTMAALVADGFDITALHNHLVRTSIPVFYMHVSGHGEPVRLAQQLHAALSKTGTPLTASPAAPPASLELDMAGLDREMGYKGVANGGVYQFSVPRAEAITDGGMAVPPAMGTAIGINFQPTGGGKAAITGDFVLLAKEVEPVLKTLRQHGIEITALHSHMIDDSPHLYFMHFWANDDAVGLAHGLRAALDVINVKRGS